MSTCESCGIEYDTAIEAEECAIQDVLEEEAGAEA